MMIANLKSHYLAILDRTTGGSGGTVTTVSTLAQFTAAVDEDDATPRIVVVSGTISGEDDIRIGSNKTIVGLPGATFDGIGLYLREQSNIIIRNIISSKVLASTKGDGIRIDVSVSPPLSPHRGQSLVEYMKPGVAQGIDRVINHVLSLLFFSSTSQESTNVWIDHCELYSDLQHDKDYYDGLIDASHAADFITIS